MDIFPKFIVEEDTLVLGKVTYHSRLAMDKEKVKGGGWFKWNEDQKMIVFYGESVDFKKASIEDIRNCILAGNVFDDILRTFNITDEYDFGYDTGTEIINLKTMQPI